MAFWPLCHNLRHKNIAKNAEVVFYYIALLFAINLHKVRSLNRLELSTSNACSDCQCQPGEYANDFIVCDGEAIGSLREINVLSLPHYINAIQISNVPQTTFKRGAIRISEDKKFSISITNVTRTKMSSKSLTLISATSKLRLNVEVAEDLQLDNRFVSAKSGIVDVTLDKIDSAAVDGRAFDVLDKITIKNIGILHLEQLSFKPNVPPLLQQPEFVAEFTNIRSISSIPSDSFPSAARIQFTNCNISNLETNAFSGNLMTNLTFNNAAIEFC